MFILNLTAGSNFGEYYTSIVDQLIKLKSLLDTGLLTKDEFNQQKNKLIDEN